MIVTKMQCGLLCFVLELKYAACLIPCILLWIKLNKQQNRFNQVADQGLKTPSCYCRYIFTNIRTNRNRSLCESCCYRNEILTSSVLH